MLEEMANVEDESDEGCSDEEVEEETEDVEVCGMDESQVCLFSRFSHFEPCVSIVFDRG